MSAQVIEFSSFRLQSASKPRSNDNTNRKLVSGNLAIDEAGVFEMSWADGNKYDMKCQICEDLDKNLQDFVDGELDEISRQRLAMHLNACADFQQRLEEYQFLKLTAASLDSTQELDSGIKSRLRANLERELGFKNKL